MDTHWKDEYQAKLTSFEDVAKLVRSGDYVAGAGGAINFTPDMVNPILDRYQELEAVKLSDAVQMWFQPMWDASFMEPLDGNINYLVVFGTPVSRALCRHSDYYPVSVSDCYMKLSNKVDILYAQVTPPNKEGYVNFSLCNLVALDTIRNGRKNGKLRLLIGQVNDQLPVVYGDNWMHVSEFDYLVEKSWTVPAFSRQKPGQIEETISQYVVDLINDRDTIQLGIGGIPEAVVSKLDGKRDLGVHSEMLPGGLYDLCKNGIVTNQYKPINKGVSIGTFCVGDQDMYDFVSENPAVQLYPGSYTANPAIIAQHPNMKTINNALLIDFNGQYTAEGIGYSTISGTGGHLCFVMGAHYSPGGEAITVMKSASRRPDGSLVSSILPQLPPGTPVTVPRIYAQTIVTEYGIAKLKYKSVRERAEELISIAHPDLRGELRASLKKSVYTNWGKNRLDVG